MTLGLPGRLLICCYVWIYRVRYTSLNCWRSLRRLSTHKDASGSMSGPKLAQAKAALALLAERAHAAAATLLLVPFDDRAELHDLTGLSVAQVQERVAAVTVRKAPCCKLHPCASRAGIRFEFTQAAERSWSPCWTSYWRSCLTSLPQPRCS